MRLNKKEFWEAIKQLRGKCLYTYVDRNHNTIVYVEDSNKPTDKIIIEERETCPIREDIEAAYELLYKKGSLTRKYDLAWLAGPEKKTSSIVFRIIGEIEKDFIEVDTSPPETISLKDFNKNNNN